MIILYLDSDHWTIEQLNGPIKITYKSNSYTRMKRLVLILITRLYRNITI